MRRACRRLTLPALVAWALLLESVPARADLVLDQNHDPTGIESASTSFNGTFVPPTVKQAQTFTVGVTGILEQVDVWLRRFPTPPVVEGNVFFEIRATQPSGAPAATEFLLQTSLPAASIPTPISFVSFDLSAFNLPVTAGDKLAFVLYTEAGVATTYVIAGTGGPVTGDVYLGGAAWGQQLPSPWGGGGSLDWGFRTFVNTGPAGEVIPEPGTLALFALGAVGVCGYAWRRRR